MPGPVLAPGGIVNKIKIDHSHTRAGEGVQGNDHKQVTK